MLKHGKDHFVVLAAVLLRVLQDLRFHLERFFGNNASLFSRLACRYFRTFHLLIKLELGQLSGLCSSKPVFYCFGVLLLFETLLSFHLVSTPSTFTHEFFGRGLALLLCQLCEDVTFNTLLVSNFERNFACVLKFKLFKRFLFGSFEVLGEF